MPWDQYQQIGTIKGYKTVETRLLFIITITGSNSNYSSGRNFDLDDIVVADIIAHTTHTHTH